MPSKIKEIGYRPTWAEVDLSALDFNLNQIRRMISADTRLMVTVKSDAYGHGIIPVSQRLVEQGVDYLGVASIDEGLVLRRAGITKPILILGNVLSEHADPLFEYNLTQSVSSYELAEALNKKGAEFKKRLNIHIKVDTGMARLGIRYQDALSAIKRIKKLANLNIEGIFTHFPLADSDAKFTDKQITLFSKLIAALNKSGIRIPLRHAANSMGVIGYKNGHFNLVRPGLIVYGLYPDKGLSIKLKPLLSLKTRIIYLKRVPKDSGISYAHTYITLKDTTIVTIPIGYGDGYPRNLSNLAHVLIRGKRFRISGRVCMDYIMVDVGDTKVKIGDEVVLIGSQGKEFICTEELAGLADTIPYEIVCGIGSRVPRLYV